MEDIVVGKIVKKLDKDNFQLRVTHFGARNAFSYSSLENIHVTNNCPNLEPDAQILCKVDFRDVYNRLNVSAEHFKIPSSAKESAVAAPRKKVPVAAG